MSSNIIDTAIAQMCGKSHFSILADEPGEPQELESGEKAGSWVHAGGVTLVLRDLWQQFPKELRAESDRLTA